MPITTMDRTVVSQVVDTGRRNENGNSGQTPSHDPFKAKR